MRRCGQRLLIVSMPAVRNADEGNLVETSGSGCKSQVGLARVRGRTTDEYDGQDDDINGATCDLW